MGEKTHTKVYGNKPCEIRMGFFALRKKNIQGCMTINHAKSAWVFSSGEKTHTKVYGFEHPYQKKSKS
jgi:hypothetical protein